MLSNSKLYQTNLNVRAGIYFTKQPEFCFVDRLDGVGVSVAGKERLGGELREMMLLKNPFN
jgi:hypothetical protein